MKEKCCSGFCISPSYLLNLVFCRASAEVKVKPFHYRSEVPRTGATFAGGCFIGSASSLVARLRNSSLVLSLPSAHQRLLASSPIICFLLFHPSGGSQRFWGLIILLPPPHPSHLPSCPLPFSLLYSILPFSAVSQSFHPSLNSSAASPILLLRLILGGPPPSSITSTPS